MPTDDEARQTAFMSALTTEHFVLQTAASGTISEAAARTTLYVMALSSALVAMGFASRSPDVFLPFVATVLPSVFILGVFTVMRLIDTALESQQYLAGIARIRAHYRTLTPEAAEFFSADRGRWPEARSVPALGLGALVAFLGTSASTVAFINSVVAGAGVTLLATDLLGRSRMTLALSLGVGAAIATMLAFYVFQRWRFEVFQSEQGFRWSGEATERAPSGVAERR
jgi:uncharacterized membrane protein